MTSSLARQETAGAFESLYRRHRGDVYRFVLRDVRNPDEAEDVTQIAFLNAYRALQHGDRPEKPRAWLFTIARNVTKRRFRTRSARPQEVELDPDAFEAPERDGPSAGDIREALARLRPNHRAVIVLREIGGLSYAEIAESLDISVSAVETLLFRARRALRDEIAAEERPALRLGGLVLPLPAALTDPLGSLAAWLGRRAATVQVAGALGAATVGVGVAVQSGALGPSPPAKPKPAPAAVAPAASVVATGPPEARSRSTAPKPRRSSGKPAAAPPEAGDAEAAVDVDAPGVPQLGAQLPAVPLPDVEVTLPSVPLPDPGVPLPDAPELPLPELEQPDLPAVDADELLP